MPLQCLPQQKKKSGSVNSFCFQQGLPQAKHVCLLTRLGCLTLIHENDSCLSQSTVQCSTISVRCASSAEPSNDKGSSAKIGMCLKGCMPKVQCILTRLGAWQSYKLVGILITEYFFYRFPLHAYLRYACSSSAFLILPFSPLPFTFLCFGHNQFTYRDINTHLKKTACKRHTKRRNGFSLTCCIQWMTLVRNGTLKTSFLSCSSVAL